MSLKGGVLRLEEEGLDLSRYRTLWYLLETINTLETMH